MNFRLHLLIVAGALAMPLELNHWLRTHQVMVDATVVSNRIVYPQRARVQPFVSLAVTFDVNGRSYTDELRLMAPADLRYDWNMEEILAAKRFVAAHHAGDKLPMWVPELLPGDGATLASDGFQPSQLKRSSWHLAFIAALVAAMFLLPLAKARRVQRPPDARQ